MQCADICLNKTVVEYSVLLFREFLRSTPVPMITPIRCLRLSGREVVSIPASVQSLCSGGNRQRQYPPNIPAFLLVHPIQLVEPANFARDLHRDLRGVK